ncbi:hypothetical protein E2562_035742, partial [Oryza meyeriana var. granulata]
MDRPPHLDIDLNEAPSPPACETPPPGAVYPSPPRDVTPPISAAPAPPFLPPQQPTAPAVNPQMVLPYEARELALRIHQAQALRVAAATAIESVTSRAPPFGPPPPAQHPGEAGRGNPPLPNDWICPECEMRGARTNRWKLGPVQLDINVPPPGTPDTEDPVAVATREVTRHVDLDERGVGCYKWQARGWVGILEGLRYGISGE